jgi:hypothetical protein
MHWKDRIHNVSLMCYRIIICILFETPNTAKVSELATGIPIAVVTYSSDAKRQARNRIVKEEMTSEKDTQW